jgi:hypothetical protein
MALTGVNADRESLSRQQHRLCDRQGRPSCDQLVTSELTLQEIEKYQDPGEVTDRSPNFEKITPALGAVTGNLISC